MHAYKLDTRNDGCDEILFGDSIEDVTADVLHHRDIDELPEHWDIVTLHCHVEKRPACDANMGHRFEAYDGAWCSYIGAADHFEDAMQYGGCCEKQLIIVDTA